MDAKYIRKEIESVPPSERAARVAALAAFYGVTKQTIWRKANEAGLRIRSEKRNKGETAVSDEILELIAARVLISRRLNKQFTNPIKKAYEDLKAEGADIPVGYQRICALLKERGLDKSCLAAPAPHRQLVSLHPNHVHQFDVTNCLQWHFENKGGLSERDIERTLYKNKVVKEAKKIKRELLRFVLVDHCSGACFFWYYYATGERAEDGADFFYRAWADKTPLIEKVLGVADYAGAYQLQGVPKILVSDKGSILRNRVMENLMAGLGVKIELHQAGNPRAKGMVEGLMKIIGYEFESNLRRYNINCLEDLNRFALDWCVNFNCEAKFRNFQPRARLWMKIKPEELRLCPDETIFKKLQHKPQESRKCDGNCVISYDGRNYQCPDANAAHKKVIVKVNAYEYPAVDIHFNGNVYKSIPLDADEYGRVISADAVTYGEYRARPETDLQKAKTRLERIARDQWGVAFKGEKQKRRAMPPSAAVLPEIKTKPSNVVFLKKQGAEIETPDVHAPVTEETLIRIDRPRAAFRPRLMPVMEAIRMYVAEYGPVTPEQNKLFKTMYPDGVPAEITATEIFNALNNPTEETHARNNARH